MIVLSVALAALLIVPRLRNSNAQPVASSPATSAPVVATRPPAAPTPVTSSPASVASVRPARPQPTAVTSTPAPALIIKSDTELTNLMADPPVKALPELERDYTSTTNRDTRLDLMMDIAEAGNADAIRTLTRLFDAEMDPELKVDLLDSLLGIEGFKDEKLIMLTLGIRQGLPADVRQSAIDGLIDLEDTRSIALLNGLLNDPDPEIRQSAQDAIEIIQTPPTQIPKLKP